MRAEERSKLYDVINKCPIGYNQPADEAQTKLVAIRYKMAPSAVLCVNKDNNVITNARSIRGYKVAQIT